MQRNKLFYTGNLPVIGSLSIKCSHRGGIARLCGFTEFINPSIPPIHYLSMVFEGGMCNSGGECQYQSGACTYSPIDCSLTNTGILSTYINNVFIGTTPEICSLQGPVNCTPSGVGISQILTSNSETRIGTGFNCNGFTYSGTSVITLSNIDTESNAINRLLAGSDGIWSTFIDSQSGGCCQAWWESRNSDSFSYKEIMFNVIGSGFTVGHMYMIPVEIYRSIYSNNFSFSLYSTRYYTISPDINGDISFIDTVPNEEGFITYATVDNILSLSSCGPFGTPPPPTFSPMPSAYTGIENISILESNPTAIIYYTTDGSTPTTLSPIYSSAIIIPPYTTFIIKAIAANGSNISSITIGNYDKELAIWNTRIINNNGTFTGNSYNLASNFLDQLHSKAYQLKIKWLLPLLGANLSAAQIPIRDILNVGASTSINFTSADFTESTGLKGDGIGKYFDTKITPTQLGLSNDGGLGWWENDIADSITGSSAQPFGSGAPTGTDVHYSIVLNAGIGPRFGFRWGLAGNSAIDNITPINAHYYGQRSAPDSKVIYQNGSLVTTNTTFESPLIQNKNITVCAWIGYDSGGNPVPFYWSGRCAVAYMTDGTMASGDIADFHTLLQNYLITPTGRDIPYCLGNSEWSTWISNILSNGGVVNSNSQNLACNLITQLESRSYSSKIKYLMPLLGSNLAAALVPLRDALNIGIPINTNFINSDFSEAHGLQGNGTNKFLRLSIGPAQLNPSNNNGGLGFWENNINFSGTSVEPIGAYNTGNGSRFTLDLRNGSFSFNESFSWGNPGNASRAVPVAINGHYYGQRISSTNRSLYQNGSLLNTNTVLDTTNSFEPIEIMGCNEGGTQVYWGGRCACTYLTDGTMASSDITDFHSLLQTYLITPLGR